MRLRLTFLPGFLTDVVRVFTIGNVHTARVGHTGTCPSGGPAATAATGGRALRVEFMGDAIRGDKRRTVAALLANRRRAAGLTARCGCGIARWGATLLAAGGS